MYSIICLCKFPEDLCLFVCLSYFTLAEVILTFGNAIAVYVPNQQLISLDGLNVSSHGAMPGKFSALSRESFCVAPIKKWGFDASGLSAYSEIII